MGKITYQYQVDYGDCLFKPLNKDLLVYIELSSNDPNLQKIL